VRFEWCWLESGSGSIGRVVVVFKKGTGKSKKMEKCHTGNTKTPVVWRGVAVVGCSWYRRIEESSAVRMV
jgi:hypothetical protein